MALSDWKNAVIINTYLCINRLECTNYTGKCLRIVGKGVLSKRVKLLTV